MGNTAGVATEILLGQISNLDKVVSEKTTLSGVVGSSSNGVIADRSLLVLAHQCIINHQETAVFGAIESIVLINALSCEAETYEGAVAGHITVLVLQALLDDRTGKVGSETIPHSVVEDGLQAEVTLELARRRFKGDNLSTTDSLTDACRGTTKDNLNLSNSLFRDIYTRTFADTANVRDHATLTTGGTGTTIVITYTTDGGHNALY